MGEKEEHEGCGEGGVDVRCKLTSAVSVSEEVPGQGEDSAEGLEGDVQAVTGYLRWEGSVCMGLGRGERGTNAEDHAGGEDDAEGEDLNRNVDP